jgi:hypothetical protein
VVSSMIPFARLCIALLLVVLHSGCSDAGLIDTPRVIDTLSVNRTIVRSIDASDGLSYMATVNGSTSFVGIDPGTQVTLHRMSDSTWFVEATIHVSNRSQVPFLPVDVMQFSLNTSPLPADTLGVAVRHSILNADRLIPSASISLFNLAQVAIDYTDSTRVRVTVTRGSLSEQRTLNDIHITRTYSGFSSTYDTVLVPWDVFGLRDTVLQRDTSYAITTHHVGDRSEVKRHTIEPPLFGAQPIQGTIGTTTAARQGSVQINFTIPAAGNSALTALLGVSGSLSFSMLVRLP